MDSSIWGFIGAIAGTFIGASASIITTIIASRNAVNIQQETDKQQRLERARAFQRDTLLEIQDVLNDALRLMAQSHFQRENSQDNGIPWEETITTDEVDENARLANRKLEILNERISNDTLRDELHDVRTKMTTTLLAASMHEARDNLFSVHDDATKFLKNLGAILRTQY